MLQIGLERLLAEGNSLGAARLGYLSNQASTGRKLIHGRKLLADRFGEQLTCLFSPQHGFYGEKQDNMIESGHIRDDLTGLPVFSLYGQHRKPTREMFDHLDVLLFDLWDVGTRVYTFMYTMAYCLEAAAEFGKKVVILDRPNPIGGKLVEGNILKNDCRSFVGLYPLPMRHGMTLGELALMFNKKFGIGADLDVVTMTGWDRSMLMRDTGFPWLPPSPNMPAPETALVYPGQVIWEGANVSEGRGTTMPFAFVGAPYWNTGEILEYLRDTDLPGCFLRPIVFEPTSGKWAQTPCRGFHVCVTDADRFMPYRTGLALFQAAFRLYPEGFAYKQPPYEYEFIRLPMDLILGDGHLRRQLEQGKSILSLEEEWAAELHEFAEMREEFLLY